MTVATATRMFFPAGDYRHPPAGVVQLRVIRSGSSYAEMDLGSGLRRVFTRPGDLLLSLPDRATRFRIEEPRELTMITIDTALASKLLASAGGTLEELVILTDRPMRDSLLAEVCRRLESDPPINDVVRKWALGLIFASLLRLAHAHRTRQKPTVLTSRRFDRVRTAIDTELERVVSIDHLAEIAGMPRRAFTAAFRAAAGLPVHQFILRSRVDRAVDLLENSALPLAEIAQRAGFTHQSHMNRVVTRLKGLSPGRLRSRSKLRNRKSERHRMLKRPLAEMPDSLRTRLETAGLLSAFEQRPPYQRNDYLHWIARAGHPETRRKRVDQMIDELTKGGIYMGMRHRPSRR